MPHILASDGLDDLVRRGSQQLRDDRELIDVIFPGEQRFPLQHLREYASCAPDVYLHVVLLPRKHDFGCTVIPRRDISRHLRILYACQAEIADLQIAVLVDQNIAGLQVTVHDSGRMDIFEPALIGLAVDSKGT